MKVFDFSISILLSHDILKAPNLGKATKVIVISSDDKVLQKLTTVTRYLKRDRSRAEENKKKKFKESKSSKKTKGSKKKQESKSSMKTKGSKKNKNKTISDPIAELKVELEGYISPYRLEVIPEYIYQKILDDGYILDAKITLLNPELDIPETNPSIIPMMDFETENGIIQVEGYLALPQDAPTNGVLAKMYGPAGVYDTAIVDFTQGGLFSLMVSGTPRGYTNLLLSFTYDSKLVPDVGRQLSLAGKEGVNSFFFNKESIPQQYNNSSQMPIRSLLGIFFRTPCAVGSVNNEICPPSLSINLSWDGSTSDLDLHVQEGNEAEVYFGNQQGVYGHLITGDDTYGFGPEIYMASAIDPTLKYKVYVHAWDLNDDDQVNWRLRIEKEGSLADEYFGRFTASEIDSGASFNKSKVFVVRFESTPQCGNCPLSYENGIEARQLTTKKDCDCLTCTGNEPPITYEVCERCSFLIFSWDCNCKDVEHPANELYKVLGREKITDRDQMVALVASLFAPGLANSKNPPINMYKNIINMIQDTGVGSLKLSCIQKKLRSALCRFKKIHLAITFVRTVVKLNQDLNYMKTIATKALDYEAAIDLLSQYIDNEYNLGGGDVLDEVAKIADFGLMKSFYECTALVCRA